MMRPKSIAVYFCLLFAFGCQSEPSNVKSTTPQPGVKTFPTPIPTPSIIKNADYPGKGKVTKINLELGSVEMDHEEIVGVMAPMRMEFYVSDKKMLDRLSIGDQVDFMLRYKDGSEIIVGITKAK
ncbi:MAG: copper-binding protein [Blastocatellia bacterium]